MLQQPYQVTLDPATTIRPDWAETAVRAARDDFAQREQARQAEREQRRADALNYFSRLLDHCGVPWQPDLADVQTTEAEPQTADFTVTVDGVRFGLTPRAQGTGFALTLPDLPYIVEIVTPAELGRELRCWEEHMREVGDWPLVVFGSRCAPVIRP